MKRLVSICLLGIHFLALAAQSDSTAQETPIRLSKKFMKELDKAFSFDFMEAPISLSKETDTDLLHQWVDKPQLDIDNSSQRDTSKYTREYVAFKIYLHDLQPFTPIAVPKIDLKGMGDLRNHNGENGYYYKNTHTTLNGTSIGGFDVNALAKYIRPSEIRKRKSKEIAERCRSLMDRVFPVQDSALHTKEDVKLKIRE